MTGDRTFDGRGGAAGARSLQDVRYFKERAEQEIRRAELADHPDAARAHYLLAGFYLDLVYNGPGEPSCRAPRSVLDRRVSPPRPGRRTPEG